MKTTKKHFALFKKECEKWLKEFGLNGWEVQYKHYILKGFKEAAMESNINNNFATIFLDKNFECINTDIIKKAAKHEIIHVLLSRLSCYGQSRYISRSELEESEEELARKLEKIIK